MKTLEGCASRGGMKGAVLLVSTLLGSATAGPDPAVEVIVDCSRARGPARALHGVNCGPLQQGGTLDLSALHRRLDIPLSRLHDCHWPNPDVVDIHVVFPEFGADPTRPGSYDFSRTDDYIAAILETGSGIVYRLGESIEHSKRKYHVHPPPDMKKWATICLGVIRHYNEGWAHGFRHGIQYWEIWNEPENRPAMWTGSDEEYFRLYEATSSAIKDRYPSLKVGGPSLGDTGKVTEKGFEAGEFLLRFLGYCRSHDLPLDFFSWHLYSSDPHEYVTRARGLRRVLDEQGFEETELHLNEWNYLPGDDWTPITLAGQGRPREEFFARVGGAEGAAFAASVLLLLQDSPVDVANYYTGNTQGFGLFSTHGVPRKTFHAFEAFSTWLETPLRIDCQASSRRGLTVGASMDRGRSEVRVLLSCRGETRAALRLGFENLPWGGDTRSVVRVVDASRSLETVRTGTLDGRWLDLEGGRAGPAVYLVKVHPARRAD